MYNNIFDSHAHYDDERFTDDLDALLTEFPSVGICGVVNCATDISSCQKSLEMAERFSFVHFAAGIHPHEAEKIPSDYIDLLYKYIRNKKCVAIGEIGLDYYYDFCQRDIQKKVFEQQLQLAKELDIPVIIHDREAHADVYELLKKYRPKGIVHCFSGSYEMAKETVKLGMYIGLGGAVTFKNAKKPVEVAKNIPCEKIVLETDCPYLSPVPFRGKRNDSSLIPYTAEFIADLKEMDTQELIDITTKNSKEIFGIDE
ncbi:MAG: TatD family hydrolase [Clostridia bacterium]|nr:TatD family hydrolase [Clostridia bacterium]